MNSKLCLLGPQQLPTRAPGRGRYGIFCPQFISPVANSGCVFSLVQCSVKKCHIFFYVVSKSALRREQNTFLAPGDTRLRSGTARGGGTGATSRTRRPWRSSRRRRSTSRPDGTAPAGTLLRANSGCWLLIVSFLVQSSVKTCLIHTFQKI